MRGDVDPLVAEDTPQLPVKRVGSVVHLTIFPCLTQAEEEVVTDLDVRGALRVERRRDRHFGRGWHLGGGGCWGLDGRHLGGGGCWGLDGGHGHFNSRGAGQSSRLWLGYDDGQGDDEGGGWCRGQSFVIWFNWRAWQQLGAVLREGKQDAGGVLGVAMLRRNRLEKHIRLQDAERRCQGLCQARCVFTLASSCGLASIRVHRGQMNTDAVGVDGPGNVKLLGSNCFPHGEAGVGVRRDLQQKERRMQQGDFGTFGRRLYY